MVFTGPKGVGKSLIAWAFAQRIVCEGDHPPCGKCGPCMRVENRQSESVLFIEPQGPMIKIEAAKEILEFLTLRRLGRARIIIVDQAQLLNPQAANSLLKVLEEPPPSTYFILIVPEISQLLPTLRSRVQIVRFARLGKQELKTEYAKHHPEALPEWIFESARGSFSLIEDLADPETDSIRRACADLLSDAFVGQRTGLNQALEQARDRAQAGEVVQWLQRLLRDWSVLGAGQVLNVDLESCFNKWPQWERVERVELLNYARKMEADMTANVDRHLIFENFFNRVQER
jgi:DNA polymerase-3 subunit delta'